MAKLSVIVLIAIAAAVPLVRYASADHDAVALLDVRDLAAGGDDRAGRFVAEELGRAAGAVHLVELGVADAARELLDDDLVGPGIGQGDLVDAEGAGLGGADDDAGIGGHDGGLLLR